MNISRSPHLGGCCGPEGRAPGTATRLPAAGRPPGTAAVWKYRALYLHGDEPFGQWSDAVSIAVQG